MEMETHCNRASTGNEELQNANPKILFHSAPDAELCWSAGAPGAASPHAAPALFPELGPKLGMPSCSA